MFQYIDDHVLFVSLPVLRPMCILSLSLTPAASLSLHFSVSLPLSFVMCLFHSCLVLSSSTLTFLRLSRSLYYMLRINMLRVLLRWHIGCTVHTLSSVIRVPLSESLSIDAYCLSTNLVFLVVPLLIRLPVSQSPSHLLISWFSSVWLVVRSDWLRSVAGLRFLRWS